jgi:predicted GNAT family acetyltransferase
MTELRDTGRRYEMDEQGQTSWADYEVRDGRLFVMHVESPPALRGTGAAGRLMAAMSADIRRRDFKVTPICGYAAAWLRRSHEFRDLVG